jgi:hypothetical protein
MKFDLPVGRYDIRTSPLNDFGRVTVWSQWQPLRVVISRKPELDSESDRVIMVNNRNKSSFSFSVSGNYFYKDVMKIAVRNPRTKRNLPIKELNVDEDGRRMLVEVEVAQAPEGQYDLVLANPFGKTLVRPGFLNVSDRKNLSELSLGEYRIYVSRLTRECKTSIPDILIKRCEKYFVVLNLSDRDRADLYHYLRMTGENYQDRLSAYDYYAGVCPPVFGPGREYMRERLASHQAGVDVAEKESIARSLVRLERCGSR